MRNCQKPIQPARGAWEIACGGKKRKSSIGDLKGGKFRGGECVLFPNPPSKFRTIMKHQQYKLSMRCSDIQKDYNLHCQNLYTDTCYQQHSLSQLFPWADFFVEMHMKEKARPWADHSSVRANNCPSGAVPNRARRTDRAANPVGGGQAAACPLISQLTGGNLFVLAVRSFPDFAFSSLYWGET